MAQIEIDGSNFRGAFVRLNGYSRLDISRLDFVRAIFTLGALNRNNLFRGRWWRGIPYRLFSGIGCLYLLNFSRTSVMLDSAFKELDMSEKSAASYWMGMGFTKLVAERLFTVPWLAHVDSLISNGSLIISPPGGKRGDLAGYDGTGGWHIFEAKGRSQRVQPKIIRDAKNQASRVLSINGYPPLTASASIARLFTYPVSVILDDPDQHDEGEHWNLNIKAFLEGYYQPFIDKINESERKQIHIQEYKMSFFEVDLFDEIFWFGILNDIIKNPSLAPDICHKIIYDVKFLMGLAAFFKTSEKSISIGKDGLILMQSPEAK